MTQGIVLLSFGKRGYEFSAYNLALSIKYFNPDINITLLTDSIKEVPTTFFDVVKIIPILESPAKTKASIYEFLQYDYNIFIDADSIMLRNIGILFDHLISLGGYYYTHVTDTHIIGSGKFDSMYWADIDLIQQNYNLENNSIFYATNSSFQFIKKCENSKKLFDRLQYLLNNPIPIEKLAVNWGGGQPDELYLNIALNELGISAYCGQVLFLGNKYLDITFDAIIESFYIFTFFGGKGFTKVHYLEWYDRMMHVYCQKLKLSHIYKMRYITPDKHLNNK